MMSWRGVIHRPRLRPSVPSWIITFPGTCMTASKHPSLTSRARIFSTCSCRLGCRDEPFWQIQYVVELSVK
jgi:hypothetical protein